MYKNDKVIRRYSASYKLKILKRNNIKISMTEENRCCENALAERVNGILKDEFYLDQTFNSLQYAKRAARNVINLYNSISYITLLDYIYLLTIKHLKWNIQLQRKSIFNQ